MSNAIEQIEIPAEIAEKLKAVKRTPADRRVKFEPWMDKVLLECWQSSEYKQDDVAKVIGRGNHQCRRRYNELIEQQRGDDE